MLSEETLKRIMEYERGIPIMDINSDADEKIDGDYSHRHSCYGYCDQCSSLKFLPDPDPDDWFRDDDMKAVCLEVNCVLATSLEKTDEDVHIPKPLYCPKIKNKLTEEEKQEASKLLERARKGRK